MNLQQDLLLSEHNVPQSKHNAGPSGMDLQLEHGTLMYLVKHDHILTNLE